MRPQTDVSMVIDHTPRNQTRKTIDPADGQTDDRDGRSPTTPIARRSMLGLVIGAGAAAVLTGCGSTPSRHGRIGEPIPSAPDYRPLTDADRKRVPMRRPSYRVPRETLPPRVTILSRQTWSSSGPVLSRANRMGKIRSLTIHHDGMSPFTSTLYDDTARRLEAIRASHVNKGWADIGYHYAIDPAGRVWACRPESLQGAHVKDHNPGNIGILVLGNYEHHRPTAATKATLDSLIATQMDTRHLTINRVFTHREWASTACPGRHLQDHMVAARASGGHIQRVVATIASA